MDNKDSCYICYDDIIPETKCTLLPCGHNFCIECVNISIKESNELNKLYCCPLDNRKIVAFQNFDPVLKAISTKSYHILELEKFREWYKLKNQVLLNDIKTALLLFINVENIFNNLQPKLCNIDKLIKSKKNKICKKGFSNLNKEFLLLNNIKSMECAINTNLFTDKLMYYDSFFTSFYKKEKVIEALLDMYNMWINFNQLILYLQSLSLISDHLQNMLELGFKDRDFLKKWNISYNKLKSEYILLSNTNLAMKSIFLSQPNVGDMSICYEKSPRKCHLCSTEILEKNNLQIESCEHSICRDCVDRFSIVNPQCMSGCISKNINVPLNDDRYMLNISKENFYLKVITFLKITCNIIENSQNKLICLTELFGDLLSFDYSKVYDVNDHIKNKVNKVIFSCNIIQDQGVHLCNDAFLTCRKILSYLQKKQGYIKECNYINLYRSIMMYRFITYYNKVIIKFITELCKFNITNQSKNVKKSINIQFKEFKKMCKTVLQHSRGYKLKEADELIEYEELVYETFKKFKMNLKNVINDQ